MNRQEMRCRSSVLALLMGVTLAACGTTETPETGSRPPPAPRAASLSTTTGSMTVARNQFTTTPLTNGKVLVAGGSGNSYPTIVFASAELHDPATGTWSATGSMPEGRYYHTAVRLNDGSVLVVGGSDGNVTRALAMRYDPATGTWSTAGNLATPRWNHTSTVLADGRVLVTGGTLKTSTSSTDLASCELFDPATNTWTTVAPMNKVRRLHFAALLPDGKVLAAGGETSNTAELYDPATNTWSYTAAPSVPRQFPVSLTLTDGRVFVVGGQDRVSYTTLGSAEIYDPVTGTWSSAGAMSQTRQYHTGVVLSTGKVLVFGGYSGTYLSSVERFDPATGLWNTVGPMTKTRGLHGTALLSNERVLLVGGNSNSSDNGSAELYVDNAPCTPTTCAAQGKSCGTILDGCGGTLVCGSCSSGYACSMSNVCTTPPADARPTVQVTEPVSGDRVQGSAVIRAIATDDQGIARVDFFLNGSRVGSDTSAPYEYTWDTLGYANGNLLVYARAYDTVGQDTLSTTVQVTVANDKAAPTAALVNPTAGQRTRGAVPMQVNLSDDIGVTRLEVSLDGTLIYANDYSAVTSTSASFTWDSTSVADGAHTVLARVYDGAGRVGESAPVQFSVDNTPPAVTVTSPVSGATVEGLVTVTADVTDAQGLSEVALLVDGVVYSQRSAYAPYSFTWDSRTASAGPHTVAVRAKDVTGNQTVSTAVQVNIPPDVTPPTVAITSPAPGTTVSGQLVVQITASDDRRISRVEFLVDGSLITSSEAVSLSITWDTTTVTNGAHTLQARARDLAGNTTDAVPVNITVNNIAARSALYDATRKAPGCALAATACDSVSLLNGRGPLGPESNAPNTLGSSCQDGTSGSYHGDESLDRLKVSTLDGTTLAAGKTVRIEATVWAWSAGSSDSLDLYYTANANSPSWTYLATLHPTVSGQQVLSATYTLPAGALQAVRGVFRYGGAMGSCVSGSYNDHDDLFFAVQ